MPSSHEQFVSMSTSRDQGGAVLYVVSRSGKVLRNHEQHQHHRSRRFVDGNYFEGELEGWIFWGSSKGNSSNRYDNDRRRRCHQDAGGFVGGSKSYIGNSFSSGRATWTTRIPFVAWGQETDSVQDFFSPMDWTQTSWPLGRKTTTISRRHHAEAGAWKGAAEVALESPLVSLRRKPHDFFQSESERWRRMEQSFKIGLSQVAILQKSDIGSRWEPGSRELAARWAAWLLKMLRKTRSRPLQHLLFTMFSAVLPVICCSLVREQRTPVPDQELCRSVEIVWKALEKSYACFTQAQWEILQERLVECRQMQMKLENLTGRCPRGALLMEKLEISLCRDRLKNGLVKPFCRASEDTDQLCYNSRDEELSNVLLKSEGVSVLVERALREKLSSHHSRHMDGNGLHGFSGGAGRIVSLVCPISRKRIKVPARGKGCSHLSSFDLESFLEEHAKNDKQRSNSVRHQKKQRVDKMAWCCPICGADATWPQIVVDRVLSRILEVLPEHMPQVCLLPNGRWRVVWSPVGLDLGQNDAKLTTVAVHLPFESTLKDDMYTFGQPGELGHDTCKAIDQCLGYQQSCGFHEVQILHRAYKAWKDGMDHLSKVNYAEQSKLQSGARSTDAVWIDDDHNPSRDTIGRASLQKLKNMVDSKSRVTLENTESVNDIKAYSGIVDSKSRVILENTESVNDFKAYSGIVDSKSRVTLENTESVNDIKAYSGIVVAKDLARISDAATSDSQKIKAHEEETEIRSARKSILRASLAPQLRIGQHKSRPKLMARKN